MEENFRSLKPYIRGLPLIVFAMMIGFFGAKKYLTYVVPIYESTAKLELADVNQGLSSSNLFKDLDVFATTNKISTEVEVLLSEVLLKKVVDELDFGIEIFRKGRFKTVELYHQSPVIIQYRNASENAFDELYDFRITSNSEYEIFNKDSDKLYKGTFGSFLKIPNIELNFLRNDTLLAQNPNSEIIGDYQFEILSKPKLISKIKKNLDISAVDKDIPIIRVSYKSSSPKKTVKLANKLIEIYIQDFIENKYRAANITVNFLEEQIAVALDKLRESEKNIQNYRDKKEITNIRQETETGLRQIAQFEIQQINLKMKLEAIISLDQYIHDGKDNFLELAPNFEAFTDLLSTEMVKKIKSLQAEKKDLLLIYKPTHEKVLVINAKLHDLTDYLIESIGNTRKSLEIQYANLNEKLRLARLAFVEVPEKEKVMKTLEREFNIYQRSYNYLNEKKIEAEIAQAAKIAFHRVITHAEIPKDPISPNRSIIMIVSILLGMFLSLAFIFIVHTMKAKVNDQYTIETNSLIPIAALTPNFKKESDSRNHFLKQAIQLEVKKILKSKDILCFSAFSTRQGASLNALGLATALVDQGRKTLFIDTDNELELIDSVDDIVKVGELNVTTLTDPKYTQFTKQMMREYLDELNSLYDVIIILNEGIDTQKSLLLMSVAQSNFVVLDTRLTPANKVMKVDLLKDEFQLKSIFFILNRYAYNPNVVEEMINVIKYFAKKRRRRRRKK